MKTKITVASIVALIAVFFISLFSFTEKTITNDAPYPYANFECGNLKLNYGINTSYAVTSNTATSAYTINPNGYFLKTLKDTVTIVLPDIATVKVGKQLLIKAGDAGSNTVDAWGSQTIDGAATKNVTTFKTLWIIADGGNDWSILSFN